MVLKVTVIKLVLIVVMAGVNCQYIRPIEDTWPWVSYTSSTARTPTTSTTPAQSTLAPRIRTTTTTPRVPVEVTFEPESDIDEDYVRVVDMKTNREFWIPRDRFYRIFGNRNKGSRPARSTLTQLNSRSRRGAYSSGWGQHSQGVKYSGSSIQETSPSRSPCKYHSSSSGYGWHYACHFTSAVPCKTNCHTNHRNHHHHHHHQRHSCGSHQHNLSPTVKPSGPYYGVHTSTKSSYVPYVPGWNPDTRKPTTIVYPTSTTRRTSTTPTTWRTSTTPTTTTERPTTTATERSTTTTRRPALTTKTPTTTEVATSTTEAQYIDGDGDYNEINF